MSDSRGRLATSQERPPSKGLSVNGSAPPSRQGPLTPPPGTSGRARTSGVGSSPVSVLAKKLILKMRARFGEAAADVKGQEIISQEVMAFMGRATNNIKEEDVVELENKIRSKLTGGTPKALTMVLEKQAQVEGDEWGRIFQYDIQKGKLLDRAAAEAARARQVELRGQLNRQMEEQEARKRAERDDSLVHFHSEQASYQEWQVQQEARAKLQADIIHKVAQERQEQLEEKNRRRQNAMQRVREDEEDLAARIAYETKEELKREEEEMSEAKSKLKTFLTGNEANKALREEAKLKEFALDAKFRKEWEAILDKQEWERTERLHANHVKQTLQAAAAKDRPEAKRWIDQSIIDKAYKEREEAREREEVERRRRVKEGANNMIRTLNGQMKEREAEKEAARKREEEAARMVKDRVAALNAKEAERLHQLELQKLKFKAELEAQMKANAYNRRVAPMSEVERKINNKLLAEVHDWKATGKLSIA